MFKIGCIQLACDPAIGDPGEIENDPRFFLLAYEDSGDPGGGGDSPGAGNRVSFQKKI